MRRRWHLNTDLKEGREGSMATGRRYGKCKGPEAGAVFEQQGGAGEEIRGYRRVGAAQKVLCPEL